ncbi:hypothetical protein [Roseomonas sp. HF4]|uniref:hypothetical protein n=1 Tax=Roseomonas sp. HF4 TaxID=2562313 RepID=UPI0010C14711|nr:hypothetical protein [Roseomonas sp. HF4]
MILTIPASCGEVIDKLTILEIKLDRITDPAKRGNVSREHAALSAAWAAAVPDPAPVAAAVAELRRVNEALWDIEDEIREHERQADFGARFVELARSVYRTNDRRAELKREINARLGSALTEEKSYAAY